MIEWLVVPAMGVLNRFRGGGFGARFLPGHPRWYCGPLAGFIAAGIGARPWWMAYGDGWRDGWPGFAIAFALFGLCWLAWACLQWGHLMCLGRFAPEREISTLEEWCLDMADGHDAFAFGLLHAVGLALTIVLVSPWAALMPPFIVLAYEASWRWAEDTYRNPILDPRVIERAELATGLLWGALFVWSIP